MEDYIISVIEDILNGVTSMGGESGLLVQTPAQFNSSIYSWVSGICQAVAMPVAYVVLALIFTLELRIPSAPLPEALFHSDNSLQFSLPSKSVVPLKMTSIP